MVRDADSLAAVSFEVPVEGENPPRGELMGDGQAVGLEGGLRESAEVAAWIRDLVPSEQELIFYDQGYHFHVPLTDGKTPDEIVAAAASAAASSPPPRRAPRDPTPSGAPTPRTRPSATRTATAGCCRSSPSDSRAGCER